jgi:hypothetical protein
VARVSRNTVLFILLRDTRQQNPTHRQCTLKDEYPRTTPVQREGKTKQTNKNTRARKYGIRRLFPSEMPAHQRNRNCCRLKTCNLHFQLPTGARFAGSVERDHVPRFQIRSSQVGSRGGHREGLPPRLAGEVLFFLLWSQL